MAKIGSSDNEIVSQVVWKDILFIATKYRIFYLDNNNNVKIVAEMDDGELKNG